jgi:hypothetical protein
MIRHPCFIETAANSGPKEPDKALKEPRASGVQCKLSEEKE